MTLKINTHPKFSEKYQEVDNLRKYKKFVNEKSDSYVTGVMKARDNMKHTEVLEANVWELAHAPEHIRQGTLDHALRMMVMKENPVAHYSLMQRRYRHPLIEKYDDEKLHLGINDPTQTNNNLSNYGSIRRQRRIHDWEEKRDALIEWREGANLDSKWKEPERPVYPKPQTKLYQLEEV